jgi:hypothetical protein
MSFHVYVAREGFKSTPISPAEWMAAAGQCAGLDLPEVPDRPGGGRITTARLRCQRGECLSLDPHGLIHAQDPSEALVELMFELAERLQAGVYSEKLKRYQSVDDWRDKTRSYRIQRERQLNQLRAHRRRRLALYLGGALALAATLGWLFAA